MSRLVNNLREMKRQKTAYITPDNIKSGVTVYGVTGSLEVEGNYQNKEVEFIENGIYTVNADEGYDAINELKVKVEAIIGDQHMIFYSIESDDEGNLWCVNNYDKIPWWPYTIDKDGNFIVEQDDNDTAVYSINSKMELEVDLLNG